MFKRREEALKLKDLELQESLIRFSKFLQENDSKRARAEKKAADEIKARLQKEKEIEQLTEVLEELRNEKERVHEVLEKNMRCAHRVVQGMRRRKFRIVTVQTVVAHWLFTMCRSAPRHRRHLDWLPAL